MYTHPFLAKTPAELMTEHVQRLISQVTATEAVKAVLVAVAAGITLLITDRLILWVSERVPRQYRLSVKHSLPFWRASIVVVAAAIIANLLLNLTPSNLFAIAGILTFALGFAFKDYASSIAAGLIALFEQPYQLGDRVRIDDAYGEVVGYGLRGIQLQTSQNETITIPHNVLWHTPVANLNTGKLEAQIETHFYLAHHADFEQVMRILYDVAHTSKYIQLQMPVDITLQEEPWGTQASLSAYPMDIRDESRYKTDLIRRVKQVFKQEGVPYPETETRVSFSGDRLGKLMLAPRQELKELKGK